MTYLEKIKALASRVPQLKGMLKTEEATKNALVMPFIAALGYDVFDPSEVTPEFCADVGTKKGEKVDYAIKRGTEIVMLIEAKAVTERLSIENASQLYRYFSVTKARIAVLTNGVRYKFFSDLDEPNKLDAKPFLEIDLEDLRENLLSELGRLTKEHFNLEAMLSTANDLKYLREIRSVLEVQLETPDEELVRFLFTRASPSGRFTQAAREQFTPLVKRALGLFIADRVSNRLRVALAREDLVTGRLPPDEVPVPELIAAPEVEAEEISDLEHITTEDELEGFRIVRAIVCSELARKRIVMRDAKSYCAVLCDDNNRKPICRLHFNRAQKYIGLIDAERNEARYALTSVDDIYAHADALRAIAARYVEVPATTPG
ncbi:MAG: type I restriction enzyme HsdR N-terminal domain-containing protein [Myxococcota bacterium]|nr:type I restriction enzyme HsdR N-terminal domain-containing protein [Myxococcota bacterium]